MSSTLFAQILDLSAAERIRLAQDIWDSVTEIPDSSILTDWQKEELKRRLSELDGNPNAGVTWREVISEFRRIK